MISEFLIMNLKVALLIGALTFFYRSFLSGTTFFEMNRYYFLTGMLLSVIISCGSFDHYITDQLAVSGEGIDHLSTQLNVYVTKTDKSAGVDVWSIFFLIWGAGFAFQLVNFSVQLGSLRQLTRKATARKIDGLIVYVTPRHIAPFSFGKTIFLPQSCMDAQALQQILAHEKIHVKQWHSFDMLLAELFCAFVWYNPLVFILRKSIRHNLEYLTDAQIVEQGVDRQAYQYLLLSFSSPHSFPVGNSLNGKFLKNRIKMMNQPRTNPARRAVYFFALPLILCVLLSFGFLPERHDDPLLQGKTFSGDTVHTDDIDHIEIYGETGKGDTAYIYYKNGLLKKVFLKTREDNILFHEKYSAVLPGHQLVSELKSTQYEPLNDIPEEISEFTMNDEFIWLTLRDGTKERYQLSDENQRRKFEAKYGKLIVKRK